MRREVPYKGEENEMDCIVVAVIAGVIVALCEPKAVPPGTPEAQTPQKKEMPEKVPPTPIERMKMNPKKLMEV